LPRRGANSILAARRGERQNSLKLGIGKTMPFFATSISKKLGLQKWHRFPNFQFL
jgi:hypothetical protein